jgi:hypothetical protein
MLCIVMCKFGQKQKVNPIILMVVDHHTSKALLQFLIHPFGLSIYLRMIGWINIDLDP